MGRPGLSPSTTPGLRKALDFEELSGDPLIRGIQQYLSRRHSAEAFVDFDALLKEGIRKDALAQVIRNTLQHDRSVLNPPERDRTYSSTYDNDAPGTGFSRSMLNSPQAWSAATVEQDGEWMQINAESATAVFGVRSQPRVQYDEKVTAFTVQYSVDDFMWSDVDGGATFTVTSGNFDALFATPVTAQYIRITVQDFVTWPSMRAGLLVYLTMEEEEAKEAEEWKEALNKMLNLWPVAPPMDWKWPTAHGVDCKDYHPRIGGGKEVVGGYDRGKWQLANACDSSGAGHPFHSEKCYGVNGADYVDFIFTFEDAATWCSGYRQFGSNAGLNSSFTKDIEICTSDANFGPWTPVATGSHSTWQNGQTNTFTDDGTTTEWTPTAPSKYLRVRTLTNHGSADSGGILTVRFLQLKFAVASQ